MLKLPLKTMRPSVVKPKLKVVPYAFPSVRVSTLCIGIAEDGVALASVRGWRRPTTTLCSEQTIDLNVTDIITALAIQMRALAQTQALQGQQVSVMLADGLARYAVVTPPSNVIRKQECQGAAAMRFHQLYGESMGAYTIAADWSALHPFLACALPQSLLHGLTAIAKEHRFTLKTVAPAFITRWNRWHREVQAQGWFGSVYANVLTLGLVAQRRLCAVRSLMLPEIASLEWLQSQLAREALQHQLEMPTLLQLCGNVPSAWLAPISQDLNCRQLDSAVAMPSTFCSSAAELAWESGQS